jgi:hypothetical protein
VNKVLNVLIASALAAATAGPLGAQCDTSFRIWQAGASDNPYYNYGEEVVLEVGDQVDLYVHAYSSGATNPYGASAEIGAPADLGVGRETLRDVGRVLHIRDSDPRNGTIRLTAVAAGRTALGYRITGVSPPGKLERVPERCRTGKVSVTVQEASVATPRASPPPAQTADAAVRGLIGRLFTGILRRTEAEVGEIPRSFIDQVQRGGFQGLISVATTMTSSPEFRDWSLARTSKALEASGVAASGLSREALESQLLNDMYASLYGAGSQPYANARQRMTGFLSGCISGRAGNDACSRLARDLLTQPQYQAYNGELLQYVR